MPLSWIPMIWLQSLVFLSFCFIALIFTFWFTWNFTCVHVCIYIPSFYKDTRCSELGANLTPLWPHLLISSPWELGFQHKFWRGHKHSFHTRWVVITILTLISLGYPRDSLVEICLHWKYIWELPSWRREPKQK